MAKCAIYARVSNVEQSNGYSISTQLDRCREYAGAQGWEIVAEYVDEARSGTDDQRPEFQRMVKDALIGQFAAVVIYSFDRFARNMEHAVIYKSLLRREAGVHIVSVMEPMDYDSPLAFIHEGIIDLFAAFYSVNLSAKTRAGQKKAVEQGLWPRRPPLGYAKFNNNQVEIGSQGEQMAWAFREFATGKYTLATWAKKAYENGIRNSSGGKLQPNHWSRIFNNPFYIGLLRWNGHNYPGLHPPLVDKEIYDRVQAVLRANANHIIRKAYQLFLLRGLCYSLDADSPMSGATAKSGNYEYYRSRVKMPDGKKHYVPAKTVEDQVSTVLQDVTAPADSLDGLKIDNNMILALQAAANVGAVYACLKNDDQRRKLLKLVVAQYGFKISGSAIVDIEVLSPFMVQHENTGEVHNRTSPFLFFKVPQVISCLLVLFLFIG